MLHAELTLANPNAAPLGEQRARLLEAIGREGSISGAARAVGISYRAAWDAVCAMNNLVGRPLVTGQSGGRGGGGASLTPEGVRLVETFRRLQVEVARALRAAAPDLVPGDDTPSEAARLLFGGFLRTSARNALRGTVATTQAGPVSAEVRLSIGDGQELAVSLTSRSLDALGLFPGRPAIALVKAPLIRLAPATAPLPDHTNRLTGRVTAVEGDGAGIEETVDIGGGKTLCAILAPDGPRFEPGDRVHALIDPAHVILAVE